MPHVSESDDVRRLFRDKMFDEIPSGAMTPDDLAADTAKACTAINKVIASCLEKDLLPSSARQRLSLYWT